MRTTQLLQLLLIVCGAIPSTCLSYLSLFPSPLRSHACSRSHPHSPCTTKSRRSIVKTLIYAGVNPEPPSDSLNAGRDELLLGGSANLTVGLGLLPAISIDQTALSTTNDTLPDQPILPSLPIASGWKQRARSALPRIRQGGDELDRRILGTAIPSMINLAVVPIVNSVDTFWVGRMGIALALAGQAAANQVFFTLYFLVAFLPTITAPLVAKAVASGDTDLARSRVCESIFLCNILGGIGTILLVGFPRTGLAMVLPPNAPAMQYAAPYLRWRALSMIPALFSATGFAAYRGLLNTVTPLKVSLTTQAINVVLDPLLMFKANMGFTGAALATAIAEGTSGLIYLRLLLRRRLAKLSLLLKPPSWKSILPILQGGGAMLVRQAALNVGMVSAARRAQTMDPTGVSAAAYGIVMQVYTIGIVVHVAVQGMAAALVPSALAQQGNDAARQVADRTFVWGTLVGIVLGLSQFLALPLLVPLFSTLPQVQEAAKLPGLVASMIHVINGPVFAGEGVMLGLGCYKDLALMTACGVATMVGCLMTPLGQRLEGILLSLAAFCSFLAVGVVTHHLKFSPLAKTANLKSEERS